MLDEAARDAIPEHILAAFREHDVKTLGCPSVEITNWADCEPLRYTAEMEVRPRITLPTWPRSRSLSTRSRSSKVFGLPGMYGMDQLDQTRSAATHLLGVRQRLTSTEPHASVLIG